MENDNYILNDEKLKVYKYSSKAAKYKGIINPVYLKLKEQENEKRYQSKRNTEPNKER